MYNVVSKTYEGPFDILLDLIRDDEIDVTNITVLDIIKGFEITNIDEGSEFILNSANLIYLKSVSLLPKDTEEVVQSNLDLEKLMQELKRFREAAGTLEKREIKQKDVFYKTTDYSGEFAEEDFVEATLFDLLSAFKSVLAYLPKDEVLSIAREGITVKQKINEILEFLETTSKVQFIELLKKQPSREHIITAFLAILELIKLGLVLCRQNIASRDIYILRK